MGRNKLILILFLLSALLLLVSAYSLFTAHKGIKEYDVSFTINESTLGFDINNTMLTFGKIPPGSSGMREIVFENNRDELLEIEIQVTENIAEFMHYQPYYSVPARSNVTIPIEVIVSDDAAEGRHVGKLRIQIRD